MIGALAVGTPGRFARSKRPPILNPLRDIRHALNRREVHAERPSRPEKVRTIIRLQEVMRPLGERQFARRHVRHDLVVRGARDPFGTPPSRSGFPFFDLEDARALCLIRPHL